MTFPSGFEFVFVLLGLALLWLIIYSAVRAGTRR
jgi:hypothetical protein